MVGLLSVVNQQPAVVQFLINSVPDQVEGMFISGDIFPPRPNFSDYITYLKLNSEKIKNELWIRLFTVTKADIELLLESFGHLKAIGFHDCSFKGIDSDLNIDDKVEFNIQELSFEEIVDDSLTSKNFGRIVKGIQGCGLKDSLVKVNLTR